MSRVSLRVALYPLRWELSILISLPPSACTRDENTRRPVHLLVTSRSHVRVDLHLFGKDNWPTLLWATLRASCLRSYFTAPMIPSSPSSTVTRWYSNGCRQTILPRVVPTLLTSHILPAPRLDR